MSTVTILSCSYGREYLRFEAGWWSAIQLLHRPPDDVMMVREHPAHSSWKHRQAELLDFGIRHALTEWVWIVDLDDRVIPSGLDGIDALTLDTDVWLTGFVDSRGQTHVPQVISNQAYLLSTKNGYTAGSIIRREAALAVGGFDDIAFQDWGLWRKLAAAGAGFKSTGRVNFKRQLHAAQRSVWELPEHRTANMEEMYECERVRAA